GLRTMVFGLPPVREPRNEWSVRGIEIVLLLPIDEAGQEGLGVSSLESFCVFLWMLIQSQDRVTAEDVRLRLDAHGLLLHPVEVGQRQEVDGHDRHTRSHDRV